jgi:hypothetical protein
VAIATAVATLSAGGVLAGLVFTDPVQHGSLSVSQDSYDICSQPEPTDWASQVEHGAVYGLDYLYLSSKSAEVTVTGARMIHPSGGIELMSVALVPGGEVAVGTSGEKGISTSSPVLATLARRLPAQLVDLPKPAGVSDNYPGTRWELAVTVRAPADATKASLDGLVLTYRSGHLTRHLRTRDTITLGTGKNICRT